jgi:8-oxo-dGTP pyrophosphatase MutT (NUDIX family)
MSSERENIITSIVTTRAAIANPENKVLIIRRSKSNRTNVGMWEFVGGKTEKGQLLDEVLIREIKEETGIQLDDTYDSMAHVTSRLITEIPEYAGITHITITKPIQLDYTPEVTLSHEHDAFMWATKEEALKMDLRDETREALLLPSFI